MKPKIAIIGGGCSGLSLACTINTTKFDVCLLEKKNRLGSKLLVAGKGGFNLTHSEPLSNLKERYFPTSLLNPSLSYFSNTDFINFLADIGIDTYTGSSRRIFPVQAIKPIEVVNAIEHKIIKNKVKIRTNIELTAFEKLADSLKLYLKIGEVISEEEFDIVVFSLGGRSWSVTGSDGKWLKMFERHNIKVSPFQPSNCAIKVNWPNSLIDKISGSPLKNISVSLGEQTLLGEVMLTDFGMEGTPIYTVSNRFEKFDNENTVQFVNLDFKPSSSKNTLLQKLERKRTSTWTNHLKKQLNLTKTQIELIRWKTSKAEFQSAEFIASLIKSFPIEISGLAPIDEAISTVGGINLSEISNHFELKKFKNMFVLGEMLNWDAPTGGYLIQGCMSMGQFTANYLNSNFSD
ncbi:MAG: NAD(P)/FAD-dependent oxidoreductase [Crocinitomicaceae bacterium]